jgi:signal transduction histidine kinase
MVETLENILLQVSKSPIIDEGKLEQATQLIIKSVIQGLAINRVGIWLYDDESACITSTYLLDANDGEQSPSTICANNFPNYFAALKRERTIIANRASDHPATNELTDYLNKFGIVAMLDVPLRHRGKMIGVLCCESSRANRSWTEDEVAFVGILADIYGRAVSAAERVKYEQLLIKHNEDLEQRVAERTQSLEDALNNFKQAQDRLIETEKMAALGKLVAGVAHEVNTPLGIAVTATTHCEHRLKKLKQSFEDGKISRNALTQYINDTLDAYTLMNSNLERAASLIQNFKRTAVDQSSFELVECSLGDYISSLVISLRPMVKKKKVTIQTHCQEELTIKTYRGALAQVITNLISNCAEHAFKTPDENHHIDIFVEKQNTDAVVRIIDNGAGIEPDIQHKIFEPFYTTARDDGGSGLGLSIVYNLVQRKLNGTIDVQSQLNKGTTFTVRLPNIID